MGFLEEFRENDKKGLFKSDNNTISFPTGFQALDYGNGYYQSVKINGVYRYIRRLGIPPGFTTVIGTTGVGKSTFCIGAAWNIIKSYKYGQIFYIDCEKTMTMQRIIEITGCKPDDPRITLNKTHTSIEDVLESINKTCEAKENYKSEIMIEVKDQSLDGKPYKIYPPTVYVIDSLPSFNSKEFDDKTLGNNIDGMRGSKDVSRFFANCLDNANRYNLIFLVVNHIRPKAEMNPYAQPPKGLMMLGQMEQLPRGAVAQYYSNTYFRINSKRSDAYTMSDNGFTGFKCVIQLAKSKTNAVGTTFPVAFTSNGFDPYYSIYEFASDRGLLQGRNPYLYIAGADELKFARKDFVPRMKFEDGFAQRIMGAMQPYFDQLLGDKPKLNLEDNDTSKNAFDITSSMLANTIVDDPEPTNDEVIEVPA